MYQYCQKQYVSSYEVRQNGACGEYVNAGMSEVPALVVVVTCQ